MIFELQSLRIQLFIIFHGTLTQMVENHFENNGVIFNYTSKRQFVLLLFRTLAESLLNLNFWKDNIRIVLK